MNTKLPELSQSQISTIAPGVMALPYKANIPPRWKTGRLAYENNTLQKIWLSLVSRDHWILK
jgi:hypothetical protein